jgi:regulator of RNase E activity RraA
MAVSKEELEKIRKQRNADLCDALDSMGFQDKFEMDVAMVPLHDGIRFAGIAHTAEYMRVPEHMPAMSYEDFDRLQYTPRSEGGYCFGMQNCSPILADEVLVIDAKRIRGGILGSDNTLAMQANGVVGFVIDGTLRDTPECLRQKTPCFYTVRSYTHPQGRITQKSDNEPIHCAGVYVRPGDIISGDDDGVLVIPQEIAAEVADRAYKIQQKDRKNRRRTFEKLGLPFDETVELLP